MRWRTIYTDSESLIGVAPACQYHGEAPSVYDCCPHPQLETYDERIARQVADLLTEADAQYAG